ncbi:MAG: bifunctional 5,10-methylenetetrahydrofolate dehydrogenase/5,10-methenyltetrahydrofolate cyclohydrolase [Candidatus Bipolaricaulota bacterium]|nr:bifunctional 5,10-methylenetetrahydrofolate dehydrogenase/5,10-methenyltetrahydrofolate cyclohydrolase [Candidatus Bipolaricaulota bacterium]
MAQIIDGEQVATQVKRELKKEVERLSSAGLAPRLAAVLATENKGARIYAKSQARSCKEIGIDYELIEKGSKSSEGELLTAVEKLNDDAAVHGIIIQLPLPPGIDARALQGRITPEKDVEGVSAANQGRVLYAEQPFFKRPEEGQEGHDDWLDQSLSWPLPMPAPCTAIGMMHLVRSLHIDLYGMEAVVVGHSEIVGKPMALLLMAHFCTTTVCHIATKNLAEQTRRADLLVIGVGKPGLVTADMVKPGAIVIDAGINRVKAQDEAGKKRTKVVGDVDFDSVKEVASYITPVPGGVGPMTTAMLLKNTVQSAHSTLATKNALHKSLQ